MPLKDSLIIPMHKFIGWKEFSHDGEWQLKVAPPVKNEDSAYLQLSSRRWRFISRQIEGNYPNWRQLVPGVGQFTTTRSDGWLALLGRSTGTADWTRIAVEGVKSHGVDVRIFLNRNLLIKALEFALTKVETIDLLSPLRFSHEGRQMIIMPTRPTSRTGAGAPTHNYTRGMHHDAGRAA